MSKGNGAQAPNFNVTAFLPIFEPAPVLRSENISQYNALRDQLIGCFAPQDFFDLKLIMEMVDSSWQSKRSNWHKALAVERWSQQSLAFQAKRRDLQQSRQDSRIEGEAEATIQQPSDIGAVVRLEEKFIDTIDEVDHAVTWTALELAHNAALERSMPFLDGLDRMIANATVRFYKAYEALEHHRQVFRPQLREQAEAIVKAADYESNGSFEEAEGFQEFLDDPSSPSVIAQAQNNNGRRKQIQAPR
jgi:hypothetical protein